MLLKLGQGLSGGGRAGVPSVGGGGGGGPTLYSDFEIIGTHANWIALYEILMYDAENNEFFQSLTPMGESVGTLAGLSPGEYTTDSNYGGAGTDAVLINGDPDIAIPSDPFGAPEWSNAQGSGISVFVKPSVATSISSIYVCANTTYGFTPDMFTFRAGGVSLSPTSAPANTADVYQTTSGIASWYEWRFD